MNSTREEVASAASFLDPPEAISRINNLADQISSALERRVIKNSFVALSIYYLALKAQQRVVEYLNNDTFYCQVLWDSRTNLPSHPSLAADIAKYRDVFTVSPHLRALLESFSSWATLQKEEMECCCGGSVKPRLVSLEIMINTILKVEEDRLIIKFLLGVKSNDSNHLVNHYSFSKQSEVMDGLHIILICEEALEIKCEEIRYGGLSYKCTEWFSQEHFLRIFQDCISEIRKEEGRW